MTKTYNCETKSKKTEIEEVHIRKQIIGGAMTDENG